MSSGVANASALFGPIASWQHFVREEDWYGSPWFIAALGLGSSYGYCALWTFLEVSPLTRNWVAQYKIQPTQPLTQEKVSKALITQLQLHFVLVIIPMTIGSMLNLMVAPFAPPLSKKDPSLVLVLKELLLVSVVFDLAFALTHRALHSKLLFKHVHSVHHEFKSPTSWTTNYAHPVELVLVSLLVILPPKLFAVHTLTEWIWTVLSVILSVDAHTGIDAPWMPDHLPVIGKYFGGARHHDRK